MLVLISTLLLKPSFRTIYAQTKEPAPILTVSTYMVAGANPNARTVAGGSTPLHRASYAGHRAIVIMLLDKAADPRIQDEDGQTALHKAAQQGHANVVDVLLRNNSSLANIADNRGRTAEQCKHGFI